jgi:hypothetical protein
LLHGNISKVGAYMVRPKAPPRPIEEPGTHASHARKIVSAGNHMAAADMEIDL